MTAPNTEAEHKTCIRIKAIEMDALDLGGYLESGGIKYNQLVHPSNEAEMGDVLVKVKGLDYFVI